MNKFMKLFILWFLIGMMYFTIEAFWRIPTNGGYSNICMLFIGGIAGGTIGLINQIPYFYKLKIIYQTLIGVVIVLLIEFISGFILNIYFQLNIWDYSNLPFNLYGQICLIYSIFWFLLIPLAIWIEDYLRFILWKEGNFYSLKSIYTDLVLFK